MIARPTASTPALTLLLISAPFLGGCDDTPKAAPSGPVVVPSKDAPPGPPSAADPKNVRPAGKSS